MMNELTLKAICAYNESVLALDGDVADLSILAEGLLEVVSACATRNTTHVDLRVLR